MYELINKSNINNLIPFYIIKLNYNFGSILKNNHTVIENVDLKLI